MDVKGSNSLAFGLAACIVLAGPIVLAHQQHGELSGIHGLPVGGHDTVAGVEIVGTRHIDFPRIRERLRAHGADLRLGLPLESPMLCRFKEVLRDVMSEKGFPAAEVTTRHGRPTGIPATSRSGSRLTRENDPEQSRRRHCRHRLNAV